MGARSIRRAGIVLALVITAWGGLRAEGGRREDPDLEEAIDRAIDKGVAFLLKDIEATGWVRKKDYPLGHLAIQLYALLKSDVSHTHPLMEKGLALISKYPMERVYSVSLLAMAMDAGVRQIDMDLALLGKVRSGAVHVGELRRKRKEYHDRLVQAVLWIARARLGKRGCWNYGMPDRNQKIATHRFDNSNTQFAVLALGVGGERNAPIPYDVWQEIANHFITHQQKDGPEVPGKPTFTPPPPPPEPGRGRTQVTDKRRWPPETIYPEGVKARARGWCYETFSKKRTNATWNMSCAGASSLLIARMNLLKNPAYPADKRGEIDQAIRDGYAWIIRHRGGAPRGQHYFYGIYSIEKVGDLGEVDAFGGYDWYYEEARRLVDMQGKDGSWVASGGDHDNVRYQTSFALLFLNRASADLLAGVAREGRPIFYTGSGAHRADDRNWVYVPKMDGMVSVRRIVRKLRFNPVPGLVKIAHEVVANYDPERVGDLVPEFLQLRESPYKGIERLLHDLLEDVTGVDRDDLAFYEAWYRDWKEVKRITDSRDEGKAAFLREKLRSAEGVRLKRAILLALVRIGDRGCLGEIIEELNSRDLEYRRIAYNALLLLSAKTLPFSPTAPPAQREREIEALRTWWGENRGR